MSASGTQRIERLFARGLFALPAAALRILAGQPVVRDGLTLDVQCQLLLKMRRMRGMEGLGGGDVAKQRHLMDGQSRMLQPRAERPLEVRNIRLAGVDGDIGARQYRPRSVRETAPCLLFYHGGGFVIGSLDSHDGICRVLAERAGCVVVSVDYRLAPEHPAPAAASDAIAAFRDIVAHADQWSIDAKRIAVSGDSAGGNLAAVVAQQTHDDATPPCFQLLFYPTVDFARDHESVKTFASGFLLEKSSMDWFRGHYLAHDQNPRDPLVSPIYGEFTGLAPALVITGGFDPLRDEGEAYADALRDAGVAVEVRRCDGLVHGFLNFAGAVEYADAVLSDAAGRLAEALTH